MSPALRDMLISVFSFSLMSLGVKALPRIPAHEIVFFRTFVSLSLCLFALKRAGIPMFGNNRRILLLRGILGTIALVMYFYTLQELPLGPAVTLQYLSPIFIILVSWAWLKEKVTPIQLMCFGISFVGVLFIKGFDPRISGELLALGVGAAVLSGFSYTCVRRLKDEHPMVVVLYFPLVAVPTVGVVCLFDWVTPTLKELALLIYVGVTTQIAQFHVTRSYKHSAVAKVSIFNYLGVVLSVGFGYFLFEETVPAGGILGIALVVADLVVSTLTKASPKTQT